SVSRPVRNVTPLTAWLSLHPKTDGRRARSEPIILDEAGTQGGGRAPPRGWRNAPCEPSTKRSQDGGEWSVRNSERKSGARAARNEPNGNLGNLARDLSAHTADAKRSQWGFGQSHVRFRAPNEPRPRRQTKPMVRWAVPRTNLTRPPTRPPGRSERGVGLGR